MRKFITIDPVTRVEGHLAIETQLDKGKVADVRVSGRMFRGFEQLLVGRHPVDAARITQRICGICHEVHGIAASMALESLYGIVPAPNGLVLRDLILGLHLVTDHIFHFYQLTLPDYLNFGLLGNYRGQDERVASLGRIFKHSAGTFGNQTLSDALKDTGLTIDMAVGYAEAVAVRKEAASGLASVGGKVPFCHAILPGGVTTSVSSDRLMHYTYALEAVADFVRRRYLPHVEALAQHFPRYFQLGRAHGNFYANGGFSLLGSPLYTPGVVHADGRRAPAEMSRIVEVSEASYLDDRGNPEVDKPGAYTWVRALQYDHLPMEVGPLARQVVSNDPEFRALLRRFKQPKVSSSVMARILARAHESRRICDYLFKLLERYSLEGDTIHTPDMQTRVSGAGQAMSIAARGALNHEVKTEDGRVVSYRLQVPSAWNFGPTVGGVRGIVEQAVYGTPVAASPGPGDKGGNAIEVGRIVRSFDPCLACAIH